MQNILVTGGSGFIGANFVRLALHSLPHCRIINLDKLTYAGNPANLTELKTIPATAFYTRTSATERCSTPSSPKNRSTPSSTSPPNPS